MLTVSALEAVIVTSIVATVILVAASIYVAWPGFARSLISGLAVVACFLLLVAGVLAAVRGEREFHPHEPDDASTNETADGVHSD